MIVEARFLDSFFYISGFRRALEVQLFNSFVIEALIIYKFLYDRDFRHERANQYDFGNMFCSHNLPRILKQIL